MDYKKMQQEMFLSGSEEEIKAVFVKHADLNFHIRGQVDLRVNKTIFEFKKESSKLSGINFYKTLAQACVYAKRAFKSSNGVGAPAMLALVCNSEAHLIDVHSVMPALELDIDWDQAASNPDSRLTMALSELELDSRYFSFSSTEELQLFIKTVKESDKFQVPKLNITVDNYLGVYEQWVRELLPLINTHRIDRDPLLMFMLDMMDSSVLDAEKGVIIFPDLGGTARGYVDVKAYKRFWDRYNRPPTIDDQKEIVSRSHMMLTKESRAFSGSFYTPDILANTAAKYLTKALGEGWQDEYYVWDPCAGAGNLEMGLENPSRVFLSTMETRDVLLLKSQIEFEDSTIFQFDFLGDSPQKLPPELQEILRDGEKSKKLVILMNPPFAEQGGSPHRPGDSKTGTNHSNVREEMRSAGLAQAAQQLTNQFLYQAQRVAPYATLGFFSSAGFYTQERGVRLREFLFSNKQFEGGFVAISQLFEGTSASFPVAFSVLRCAGSGAVPREIEFDVWGLATPTTKKITLSEHSILINQWFKKAPGNVPCIPLQNTHKAPTTQRISLSKMSEGALGYAAYRCNDFGSHKNLAFIMSSAYYDGHGTSITPENFEKVLIAVASRHVPKNTWLNDYDMLLQPECDQGIDATARTALPRDFVTDMILWFLFHSKNKTSVGELSYKDKTMFIENEFFPFSTTDVLSWEKQNAKIHRRASQWAKAHGETFVNKWLDSNAADLTPEGSAILDKAKEIYALFYKVAFANRHEFELETWNVGWYQVVEVCSKDVQGSQLLGELWALRAALRLSLESRMVEHGIIAG